MGISDILSPLQFVEDMRGGKIIQRLEVRPNMCTNTLTGVQKDNVLIEIDESEEANVKIVCERRCDEGVRFFKDNVCGTIRTIDGGGQESD